MRWRWGAGTQLLPPVALQRVDEDGLDRHTLVGGGETAASGGLADIGPVGGTEAGTGMLPGVTIGFQQHGPVAIALLEIGGQAAQDQPEHLGGEAVTAYARPDQEPAQVQHTVQPLAAHGRRPADPFVARGDREGRCGKAERTEHTVFRFNQIAYLGPDMEDGPIGVLAGHEFVPDLALLGRRDQTQLQIHHVRDTGRHGLRGGDRLVQAPGAARSAPATGTGRWQTEMALVFQTAQGLLASRQLPLAATVAQVEGLAHLTHEGGPIDLASLRPQGLQSR